MRTGRLIDNEGAHSRVRVRQLGTIGLALYLILAGSLAGAPPFSGTIFLDPDIVTPTDPSAFVSLTDGGRGVRRMFDRRVNGWVNLEAYLFNAVYDDGLSIEVQVNPEFGTVANARAEAAKYAPIIGQLPTCLRADVETVWIHRGNEAFGGGNLNLLIHTGQADDYIARGILEETFIHEACHTSLDASHADSAEWLAAQVADNEFISTYAEDFPNREDIAESFLPYFAYRFRPDRISAALANTIAQTIPARIDYFDRQLFDLAPQVAPEPFALRSMAPTNEGLEISWVSRQGKSYFVEVSEDFGRWEQLGGAIVASRRITTLTLDPATYPLTSKTAFFRIGEVN